MPKLLTKEILTRAMLQPAADRLMVHLFEHEGSESTVSDAIAAASDAAAADFAPAGATKKAASAGLAESIRAKVNEAAAKQQRQPPNRRGFGV